MSIAAELGLGVAFTLIALAPMVPDWIKANEEPAINVKMMAGIPDLKPEQQSSPENKEEAYNQLSFGGSTPHVTIFNVNGDRVASWRNGDGNAKIGQGGTSDILTTWFPGGEGQKPEYLTVSASTNDAICIAAITVTHASSSDTYAFLPGEVGAVCGDWNKEEDYPWSLSAASVQFKTPNGTMAMARPKCLWIDAPGENNDYTTKWKGFSVHLPDFKLDNSTFKNWEQDPAQMCSSKARFGLYEKINEFLCPPVFESAPKYGARVPMKEYCTCNPSLLPDSDGKFFEDMCEDDRLGPADKYDIKSGMKAPECPNEEVEIKEEEGDSTIMNPGQGNRAVRQRRRRTSHQQQARTNMSKIQKRFEGILVKSRDPAQSAVELCNSKGGIGPNFYSHHEEKFCDVAKRTIYVKCESSDETECFDEVLNQTRHTIENRDQTVKHLSVQDWL